GQRQKRRVDHNWEYKNRPAVVEHDVLVSPTQPEEEWFRNKAEKAEIHQTFQIPIGSSSPTSMIAGMHGSKNVEGFRADEQTLPRSSRGIAYCRSERGDSLVFIGIGLVQVLGNVNHVVQSD